MEKTKHNEIDNSIRRLNGVIKELDGLINKIKGSSEIEKDVSEVGKENKELSLGEHLETATGKIDKIHEEILNRLDELDKILF